MLKNNLRLIVEFLVIISGVLLSFYIDDVRELQNKKLEKDILIEELVITAKEDLQQILNLKKDLVEVQENISLFLKDIQDKKKDLTDQKIAINYLFISEKMSVSFFPQDGIFTQLISTGSLELIKSSTLKNLLLRNFTHYLDRNQANNRTLDDLYLDFVNNVDPFITVISKDKKDASFIYTDRMVDSYSIDSDYYLSNKFQAYLSSANTMVGKNIDMLNLFEKSYNQILELANKA
ncbi:MAG: hypothetical protein MUR50_06065 [Gammaproteobacteria bacterium]|jgi:hypothetical protein|nr:hypothetical protein [Gammaproteobacteria bacterium]MDA9675932.1 hypothetical protein [Pseudomonadota bacterium]MDO7544086.1 hypothetical protein [Gammaproteobacteria bacterium]MDO7709342.1 hypothetical protein [Gammaproteobacteria bacterium]